MKKPLLHFWLFIIILTLSACQPQMMPKKEIQFSLGKMQVRPASPYFIYSQTFLGNFERNYYGRALPDTLELLWKTNLGTGRTRIGSALVAWSGAGWTGQPLVVQETDADYLIQTGYDHNLHKIDAQTGEVIWEYAFDDVLKGAGTIYYNRHESELDYKIVILQGSRRGINRGGHDKVIPSYRAISYFTGKDLWQLNSVRTASYSRDVDASALINNDTAYIGLENGLFTVFDPNFRNAAHKDGIKQPRIFSQDTLYEAADIKRQGGNLVTEASPAILGNRVYVASGSGHIYGYNLHTKSLDWDFFTGSDLDGSTVVTKDSCLLVAVERQYIPGKGGVFKLDPSLPPDSAVVWYFPTENRNFAGWEGGIIGSVAVSDHYDDSGLAAFTAIDGFLYIIKHNELQPGAFVDGPNLTKKYPTPVLVKKIRTGAAISTPLIIPPRIIAAGYDGINLFEFDNELNIEKIAFFPGNYEATPVAFQKKVYIAARDGYLYCLGRTRTE